MRRSSRGHREQTPFHSLRMRGDGRLSPGAAPSVVPVCPLGHCSCGDRFACLGNPSAPTAGVFLSWHLFSHLVVTVTFLLELLQCSDLKKKFCKTALMTVIIRIPPSGGCRETNEIRSWKALCLVPGIQSTLSRPASKTFIEDLAVHTNGDARTRGREARCPQPDFSNDSIPFRGSWEAQMEAGINIF